MTHPQLDGLSDQAQTWVYAFPRELSAPEEAIVAEALEAFAGRWRSHGEPVRAAWTIVERRFVILAGEVPGSAISGCGIDASVRFFKDLKDTHGLDAMASRLVYYRTPDGQVAAVPRTGFQQLVDTGAIVPDTVVYDLTVDTLGRLRRDGLHRPFRDSWHARAFARVG